jgi:hypothetical protein
VQRCALVDDDLRCLLLPTIAARSERARIDARLHYHRYLTEVLSVRGFDDAARRPTWR